MEMEKVPAAGYAIEGLPVAGFHRGEIWRNLSFPFKLLRSMMKARKIVTSFRPDCVIGVGGYASGPVLRVATKKGLPTVIQEQNSFAGVTNKILAKKVDKICVAYDKMERFFPAEKIVFTGNPIRNMIKLKPILSLINIRGKKTTIVVNVAIVTAKATLLAPNNEDLILSNPFDRFV
jgi:UDP-N-acetylglucosamine--N-acetylmuramyl-(pentapeptide) pyrophosphoryl-undecaprenol N-acetylglucosamine transferase